MKVCPACGGEWFRQANHYRFLKEESLGGMWPTWPKMVGQLSIAPMTLLVCLCGYPLAPEIGGVRGGRAFNTELLALLDTVRKVQDRIQDLHSGRSVLAGLSSHPASPAMLATLATKVQIIEHALARRMRSGPGRPWRLPRRKPLAKGRDQLVLAVEQKAGLTARKARDVVDKFWKVIARAIRRGEIVETPIGTFQTVSAPEPQERKRWGKRQVIYRRPRQGPGIHVEDVKPVTDTALQGLPHDLPPPFPWPQYENAWRGSPSFRGGGFHSPTETITTSGFSETRNVRRLKELKQYGTEVQWADFTRGAAPSPPAPGELLTWDPGEPHP